MKPIWAFISGDQDLYLEIIEPLGYRAKKRNDEFRDKYANIVNKFLFQFMQHFCKSDGAVDWDALVAFNSSASLPDKTLVQSLNQLMR